MKYLKAFESFSLPKELNTFPCLYRNKTAHDRDKKLEDIKLYCKDILLELDDKGFKTKVHFVKMPGFYINIQIQSGIQFEYKDISDACYHLDEYLHEQGFYCSPRNPNVTLDKSRDYQLNSWDNRVMVLNYFEDEKEIYISSGAGGPQLNESFRFYPEDIDIKLLDVVRDRLQELDDKGYEIRIQYENGHNNKLKDKSSYLYVDIISTDLRYRNAHYGTRSGNLTNRNVKFNFDDIVEDLITVVNELEEHDYIFWQYSSYDNKGTPFTITSTSKLSGDVIDGDSSTLYALQKHIDESQFQVGKIRLLFRREL
jgi:hypothetical protein